MTNTEKYITIPKVNLTQNLEEKEMKKLAVLFLAVMMIVTVAACGQKVPDEVDVNPEITEASDWAYIAEKNDLIIGITYFEPMNYKDEAGKLIGFETEFAEAVTAKMGVTPVFQVIEWASKEIELNAKKIDAIWNGMTITDERMQTMEMSPAYMENRQVMVIRATDAELYSDDANIAGAKVVAEKGSAGEEVATSDELFTGVSYTAVDAQSKALLEVKAKTADIAVLDYTMALALTDDGSDFGDLIIINGARFEEEGYGVAFRKNSPETLAKWTAAVEELTADGTLLAIAEKYNLEELLLLK